MARRIKDIQSDNGDSERSVQKISRGDSVRRSADKPPKQVAGYARHYRSKKRSRFAIWTLAILGVIFLFFLFSALFSGSKITVHPKVENAHVSGTFVANQDPAEGEMGYEIMRLEEQVIREADAAGEEQVEQRASGQIRIFNDFDANNQRLIANTRFETPEGLIYRIQDPVVVPGQTQQNGETVPGSVTVTVYADEPGSEYNVGLTDFTIPGLKGDPRYEAFYARSVTPMSGGFSGVRQTVEESEKEILEQEMRAELREKLISTAFSQKPDNMVLFEDALDITFNELQFEESENENKVAVVQKGSARGVLFSQAELAERIAEATITFYDGSEVTFNDPNTLSFSIESREGEEQAEDEGETISFFLEGDVTIVWTVDAGNLKNDLAGVHKRNIDAILSEYSSIDRAEVTMRPFWKRAFPDDPDEISVKVVLQQN